MSCGLSVAEMERPIKEEEDLDLLIKYMPEPESLNQDNLARMVESVGDRAFCVQNFIGVWGEAANMRGLVTLCTDLFDRPEFVDYWTYKWSDVLLVSSRTGSYGLAGAVSERQKLGKDRPDAAQILDHVADMELCRRPRLRSGLPRHPHPVRKRLELG